MSPTATPAQSSTIRARLSAAAQPVATAPHGTPSAVVAAFALAYQRAATARMIAYKNEDGSYSVPSSSASGVEHIVRKVGRRWYDWSCSCPGGNHVACMHRAVAVHCEKYHVSAVRPQAPRTWISAETGMAVRFDESPVQPATATRTERCPHGDWPEDVCIVCDVRHAPASAQVMRSPEYLAAREACIAGVNPFGF